MLSSRHHLSRPIHAYRGAPCLLKWRKLQTDSRCACRCLQRDQFIDERHRHRYEVNPEMVPQLEAHGLRFVGKDETVRQALPFFISKGFRNDTLPRLGIRTACIWLQKSSMVAAIAVPSQHLIATARRRHCCLHTDEASQILALSMHHRRPLSSTFWWCSLHRASAWKLWSWRATPSSWARSSTRSSSHGLASLAHPS